MRFDLIMIGVAFSFGIAALLGLALAIAQKVFHVKVDPLVEKVFTALPQSNCGGCGHAGCMAYAEWIAKNRPNELVCNPLKRDKTKVEALLALIKAGE